MPDFRMKPEFPIAEVARSYQRKGELDNETTLKQSELLNQSLTAIGGIGKSLLDQKKRVAQSLALGRQFEIPDDLAKTMEPEQILKVGAIKKGNIDMATILQALRDRGGSGAQNAATSNPITPASQPLPTQGNGAMLTSNVTATPMDAPAMQPGLTPPTTGQAMAPASIPVPIDAPPVMPKAGKTMNPATFSALMKIHGITAPHTVMSDEDALAAGSMPAGTKLVHVKNDSGSNIDDPKYQAGLEKTYIGLKSRALSNRSGGLGLEDSKVNVGIHLRKALNTMYDAKSGNYVIPPSMHTELALGMARMISPTGVVPLQLEEQLRQKTAREGLAGAMIYLGFDPATVGGTTQSVSNFFVHQLDRQAQTAEENRGGYMDYIHGQAPVDLKPETIAKHDKVGLNSYSSVLDKSPDKTREVDQHGQAIQWAQEHPNDPRSAAILDKAMKATQGAGAPIGL